MESKLSYADYVRLGCLRWLHAIDLDPISETFGFADRDYWAWKTKDFSNGTWQAGLSGFLNSYELCGLTLDEAKKVVHATIRGTLKIQRSNGSFEEAYPWESSYAVTALVQSSLLAAFFDTPEAFDSVTQSRLKEIVSRSRSFLIRTPETHGVISNHVCTAESAIDLGNRFLGQSTNSQSWKKLLDQQDSDEGWFPEYEGADPGYQTLFNHYLCQHLHLSPDWSLAEQALGVLGSSNTFVEEFCFPDGSYAGELGARGTSIVYPTGTLTMRAGTPQVTPMTHWFIHRHMGSNSCVNPSSVDSGNFVPVFNSWALFHRFGASSKEAPEWNHEQDGNRTLKNSGYRVFVDSNSKTIVSLKNGVIRSLVRDQNTWNDQSFVGLTDPSGTLTTQFGPVGVQQGDSGVALDLGLRKRRTVLNSPFLSMGLRCVALLLYPFAPLQRLLKRVLAWIAMNKENPPLNQANLKWDPRSGVRLEESGEGFKKRNYGFDRHMASSNTFDVRSLRGD